MSQNQTELLSGHKACIVSLLETIKRQDISTENHKVTLISTLENITDNDLIEIIQNDKTRQELIELISNAKKHCRTPTANKKWQEKLKDVYQELAEEINILRISMLPTNETPKEESLFGAFIADIKNKPSDFTRTKEILKYYTYCNNFELSEILEAGESFQAYNQDVFVRIIRAFVINKNTSSIPNTQFACELLINLKENEFKLLLAKEPEIFEKIREKLMNSKEPHTLLALITLETRIYNLNTGKMKKEFEKLQTELNTFKTNEDGAPKTALDITNFQATLKTIKEEAPWLITRLIIQLYNLLWPKPMSFFEQQHADKLINRIESSEDKEKHDNTPLKKEG